MTTKEILTTLFGAAIGAGVASLICLACGLMDNEDVGSVLVVCLIAAFCVTFSANVAFAYVTRNG